MNRRQNLKPSFTGLEELESKVVLSTAGVGELNQAVLVDLKGARNVHRQILPISGTSLSAGTGNYVSRPTRISPNQRLMDQVNTAFQSFQNDYLGVFNVYLNSNASGSAAMQSYLQLRTKQLSQELIPTLVLVPGFAKKQIRGGVPLITFLDRKILGDIGSATPNNTDQSLYASLSRLIPASVSTGGDSTAPIYTAGVINSIQAANTATINAMGYAAYNVFGKPSHS